MNSRILLIKSKLKKYLKRKDILDIIVFGSSVKGKALPNDVDVAVISNVKIAIEVLGFHVSFLKPIDFFVNPPSIVNTLFREGYSLKKNKSFSEVYGFSNNILFKYELIGLNSSLKVKIVNLLRGKGKDKGIVEENNGKWMANQVFLVPIDKEHIFEKFFINFKIKHNKFYVLIH